MARLDKDHYLYFIVTDASKYLPGSVYRKKPLSLTRRIFGRKPADWERFFLLDWKAQEYSDYLRVLVRKGTDFQTAPWGLEAAEFEVIERIKIVNGKKTYI